MIMDAYQLTVADVVRENPPAAAIFKKYHIDFCCNGKIPLESACEKAGIDVVALIKEIENAKHKPSGFLRHANWSKETTVRFIVENHHQYLKEILPRIIGFSERVAKVHGDENDKLVELFYVVNKFSQELLTHIEEEESQLFPEILRSDSLSSDFFEEAESDHREAGKALEKIRELTDGFTTPGYACNTYRALFSLLEELESDMHQHVHLENNILFQKLKNQGSLN